MKTFREYLKEDKEYTAFVRDKETGHATQITRTYPLMRDFKSDLRANGYRVMSIAPSNEVGSAEWERKLYDQRNKKKNVNLIVLFFPQILVNMLEIKQKIYISVGLIYIINGWKQKQVQMKLLD